jgi:starvation-inducible DNA-binding protein
MKNENDKTIMATELKKLLANEYMLCATQNYHWDIEGANAEKLYEFYENQYEELNTVIDAVIEKIKAMKPNAAARLSNYIKLTTLAEYDDTGNHETQLNNLLTDHEIIIQQLKKLATDFRDKYHDVSNTNFVVNLMEKHNNMASSIRSYLN